MKNYLRVSVYDYKGGELHSQIKERLTDLIEEGESNEHLKHQMEEVSYPCADYDESPTKIYTVKNGEIVKLTFKEVEEILKEENK